MLQIHKQGKSTRFRKKFGQLGARELQIHKRGKSTGFGESSGIRELESFKYTSGGKARDFV